VRVVRRTHRTEAQQAGRRRGVRELRDGAGDRAVRPVRHRGRACLGGRGRRVSRASGRGGGSPPSRRAGRGASPSARGRDRSHGATRSHRDGACTAVHRLGVGCARARDASRLLERDRLPPRLVAERKALRGDDGHAHLDWNARRLGVVHRRTRRRTGRGHLLRGGGGHHDADPPRALPRGPGQEPLVRSDSPAAGARRQGSASRP
jgi:hypothetical protein